MTDPAGALQQIWRFPVKSMAGGTVERAELGPLGIPGDRRWALRNLETGKILSAKLPRFGRVLLALAATLDEASGEVVVHDETGSSLGTAGSDELDAALSERLGTPVRMVRADAAADESYESWWPDLPGLALTGDVELPLSLATAKGTFVDLAALHVVATGSLARLAALLPDADISAIRFRPSLVVDTGAGDPGAFVETDWCGRTATLGGARLSITTEAPRCVMTTLAHRGADADRRVLQTLAAEHRVPFDGLGDVACLGAYAEVLEPGPVAVGDALVLDPPS